jgi:plasmid stability protein
VRGCMRLTCDNVIRMSSMIQIRNVPEQLHRELKARAAQSGMTLSDYLLAELRALAVRPTMKEWLEQSAGWAPVSVADPPAHTIAAERDRAAL